MAERDYVVVQEGAKQTTAGDWQTCTLGELTDNFDAIRIPVKETDRGVGPYPYYGASGVVDHVDGFLFDGEYLLIAEDGENLRTRTTPIAFLANGKFWVNNHAHIVQGNSNADTRFLKYALSVLDISGYLTGSTMPKLTQGNMNRIPLLTPPLPKQRTIAYVLGTLDDKIELNRRMNETLEAMARALFKSWFVDFEPVRAKMEGRWRQGESLPGLPAEHYDLFPDRLVDSDLGEVPEGWEVKALGEVATLNPESWSRTNTPADVEYVDLANTKWGVIESTQSFLWKDAPSRARTCPTPRRHHSWDGSTGQRLLLAYRTRWSDWKHRIRCASAYAPKRFRDLVYLAATTVDNIDRLAHRADGAAYPAVRPQVVSKTEVVIPIAGSDVLDCFSMTVGPILAKIESTKTESRSLAAHTGCSAVGAGVGGNNGGWQMIGMMDLNTQKSRFSLSYIEAVTSHAGFQVEEVKVDRDSVDGSP